MERLILVRHGDYDECSERLNPTGRKQITGIARIIGGGLFGKRVHVCYSPIERAEQSAMIMAREMRLSGIEPQPVLGNEKNSLCDKEAEEIFRLVEEKRDLADALLLVTHKPVVEQFPNYFRKREGRIGTAVQQVAYGEAVDIDVVKWVIKYLTHGI
jgi:phosphohistidine phosphatase SixA